MKTTVVRLVMGMLLLQLMSCASVTKQSKKNVILGASQESEIEGTGMSSADLRSMAERMARDIAAQEWPANLSKVRVALTIINNETRFPINPNIIKDRLLTDLVKFSQSGKVQFTESAAYADYFLSARITSLSKGSREGGSDYLLYSFKLVDKEDIVVWVGDYETKKQGNVGVIYR